MTKDPKEILESFRDEDELADAHPLLGNRKLSSLVHIWSKARVEWNPPKEIEDVPVIPADRWELLWSFSNWSMEELSVTSNLTLTETGEIFLRARTLRLIYPDGTVSNHARIVLGIRVSQEMKKLEKKRGRPPKVKKEDIQA